MLSILSGTTQNTKMNGREGEKRGKKEGGWEEERKGGREGEREGEKEGKNVFYNGPDTLQFLIGSKIFKDSSHHFQCMRISTIREMQLLAQGHSNNKILSQI